MTIEVPGGLAPAGRLQSYLRPAEELLWCGKPDPAVLFSATDVVAIPVSLIWLGFAIFWTLFARSIGAPTVIWMFGIPFVAIGLWLLVGRFIAKVIRRRGTVYGVTTERVLVLNGSSFRETPVKGGSMQVRRRRNGRHATVGFAPFGSFYAYGPASMTGPPMPGTGMPTMGSPTRRRVTPGGMMFSDVADADALLAAINLAKAPAAG